jgi:hypothetical protein
LGGLVVDAIMEVGGLSLFFWRMLGWLFLRLPPRGTLLPAFHQIGVLSLPVVALTGTFIGMVLAVQSFAQFRMLGMETRMGAVINMSLVRELGPVLAATMLAGRVGSRMAAELGTMRVTEQIDALTQHGRQPDPLLVVPRFLALAVDSRPDDHGRLHGQWPACSFMPTCWASTRTTTWRTRSDFGSRSTCSSGVFKSLLRRGYCLIGCHRASIATRARRGPRGPRPSHLFVRSLFST